MLDFETLTLPVSADDPCGLDLDSIGDVQYLNFFAGAEPLLPMSYFEVAKPTGERGRFDPKSINFETQFEAAKPVLARTRDLRLMVLLAKFSILSRNLDDFIKCLKAIAFLLQEQWDTVHPRGEDGDFSYRGVTVESIDVFPTVINPLQFLPLIENRRHGTLNYRAYLVAKGEIPATDDETDKLDLATIERIVSEADLALLKTISATFVELSAVLADIKTIWRDKSGTGEGLNLDKLTGIVTAMSSWLKDTVKLRDPDAIIETASEGDAAGGDDQAASGSAADLPKMTSSAVAAAALNAAAEYFARSEPSNPALLLIRQAEEMVGKSFVEVIRMMVPAYAETAAINIGRDKFFDLPIERMAALPAANTPSPVAEESDQPIVLSAESRGQALAMLGQAANFFRVSEPSSPIPFLVDRARELAQRDFLSLLHDVLPEGALKTFDK